MLIDRIQGSIRLAPSCEEAAVLANVFNEILRGIRISSPDLLARLPRQQTTSLWNRITVAAQPTASANAHILDLSAEEAELVILACDVCLSELAEEFSTRIGYGESEMRALVGQIRQAL